MRLAPLDRVKPNRMNFRQQRKMVAFRTHVLFQNRESSQ